MFPLITQDMCYHNFADQATLLGIPHFFNVITNVPFMIFGIWGLLIAKRLDWGWFFIGLVLTGIGSSYYHLNPNNATLVYDRLPMAISFMALVSAMCVDYGFHKIKLYPAILLGVASVLYWALWQDLIFYVLVQFVSLIWIFVLLRFYKSPYVSNSNLYWALACYVLAKVLEHFDREVFAFLPISGHSLKHLSAAFSGFFIIRHVQGEEAIS